MKWCAKSASFYMGTQKWKKMKNPAVGPFPCKSAQITVTVADCATKTHANANSKEHVFFQLCTGQQEYFFWTKQWNHRRMANSFQNSAWLRSHLAKILLRNLCGNHGQVRPEHHHRPHLSMGKCRWYLPQENGTILGSTRSIDEIDQAEYISDFDLLQPSSTAGVKIIWHGRNVTPWQFSDQYSNCLYLLWSAILADDQGQFATGCLHFGSQESRSQAQGFTGDRWATAVFSINFWSTADSWFGEGWNILKRRLPWVTHDRNNLFGRVYFPYFPIRSWGQNCQNISKPFLLNAFCMISPPNSNRPLDSRD